MENFDLSSPLFVALTAGLVGILVGAGIMWLFQRRDGGGKSAQTLRQELDDYREEVSSHFATTSELFHDLTDKYRDVYNHLASSSQKLCEDPMQDARLEFSESTALPENSVDSDSSTENGSDTSAQSETASV